MQIEASPLTINIMLACHVSPEPEGVVGERVWHSEASKIVRAWLLAEGLISMHGLHYRSTERGEAWVESICTTPLPVQKWVCGRAA